MAAADVKPPWTVEEANADTVSKKQLVEFLHAHSSSEFLKRHKLNGKLANVVKTSKKDALVEAYKDLFETKEFRNDQVEAKKDEEKKITDEILAKKMEEEASVKDQTEQKEEVKVEKEKPRFKKSTIKKGDKGHFPKKGETVTVRYRGKLEDGKVFDTNMEKVKGKLPPPLTFKVGMGKVIRGWDEGIQTMSVGEVATLTIEPEWAYGKKGVADAGIPPNATLIFEVELVKIDY
jgi:FK506-binding protein 3